MANKIQVKRSAVADKVPTTSDLDLGEIAINTYDGKVYIKKDVSGTPSIVEIGKLVSINSNATDILSVSSNEISADDAGADKLVFWDDSESKLTYLTLGDGLSITGTTIASSGGSGVSDGDKGDISVSSSGSVWTIDNAVVTYAKIQNVSATDKILGRSTAGAGTIEEITCTAAGRAILDDADASAQRTTLSAAASGANTDITSVYLNNTGLKIKDTNASHGLILAPGSDISADRTLTLTTGDASRTLTISGNATVSQDYSTSGTPQFASIELGNASDTTISRVSAGVIAVEGGNVPLENRANTFTSNQIISTTDNTNAALRVTQLGTGLSLRIEDETNPDATPFVVDASGNVGIATASPSTILGIGGNAARSVSMERHTTSNTAGNNLTVQAGGATSGATDKAGGNLVLASGTATGTGSSSIVFQTPTAGTTGTSDRSPAQVASLSSSGLALSGATSGTITLTPTAVAGTSVLTLPAATDTLVGRATTDTLSNKLIQPRISSTSSITSPLAWNSDTYDIYAATAQSAAFTINADSGTPADGQKAIFRILDNGTSRTITFTGGASKAFKPVGVTLTTSGSNFTYVTTISKVVYFGCIYNSNSARWEIVALSQE